MHARRGRGGAEIAGRGRVAGADLGDGKRIGQGLGAEAAVAVSTVYAVQPVLAAVGADLAVAHETLGVLAA
ncbi:hypothetical protein, partial [Nocardia farcinica]|uniref:hypothetical protein n=1 Tax=Nocardia farcinica TaxID=37329 RepID=UPI0024568BFF